MLQQDIQQTLQSFKKYHTLTNYLGASMLYLKDNFFLEEELSADHIKDRILGHWGTVPGLNFLYGGFNILAQKYSQEIVPVIGPGHGAPAILANLILEGTLGEYYEGFNPNREGFSRLIKDFSWPFGFPSHAYPGVPGTLHEGGELGYALGVGVGIAFDNPNILIPVVIGDGESETGPLAASWHSNKYLNPEQDGFVLPILHLNGYKISGPTIFGTMSEDEINKYFEGLGYEPMWVNQYDAIDVYLDYLQVLFTAYEKMQDIRSKWVEYGTEKPKWPVIIFKSMKGWSCPDDCGDTKLQDNNYSHGIPLTKPKKDTEQFNVLTNWLHSYNVNNLLNENKEPHEDILKIIPSDSNLRLGQVTQKYANKRYQLNLPSIDDYAHRIHGRGDRKEKNLEELNEYIRDVIRDNCDRFMVFSPDESESNRLEPIFDVTARKYIWPLRAHDEYFSKEGRMVEILSEHVLQEWYQGYVLAGRHGLFISYEAFFNIISSQIDQFIKYIKQAEEIVWRKPLPAMNYISTSTAWRQDHNGFTHQNPTLINSLLLKQSDYASVYFPADANIMIATIKECLLDTNRVNMVVAGKRDVPQWLSMEEAIVHVQKGAGIWEWAGTESEGMLDVVLASAGDYQTQETLSAISVLKEIAPEIKLRYVNVNELTVLGMGNDKDQNLSEEELYELFSKERHVIFNFHGYPEAIKQFTWGHEISNRMTILGYREEGTTTTPFDMQVKNGTSRYHIAIHAIQRASEINPELAKRKDDLVNQLNQKLKEHEEYIILHGNDMPEVIEWEWKQ